VKHILIVDDSTTLRRMILASLRSRDVSQMEMIEKITPVPNAPPFVDGVIFSRGQVIPALNLREVLTTAEEEDISALGDNFASLIRQPAEEAMKEDVALGRDTVK